MAHVPRSSIHAFQRRGLSVVVDVDTDLDPEDLVDTTFQLGPVVKDVEPLSGGQGLQIAVVLSDEDMDLPAGHYGWECRALIDGLLVPMAAGVVELASEPTVVVEVGS